MLNLVRRTYPLLTGSLVRSSPTKNQLFLLQFNAFSTAAKVEKPHQSQPFTITYLVNTCGFPPEKAVSASNYLHIENPDKPNSVISFLKQNGFTKTQVSNLIRRFPPVLLCDPEKTLLPKIEFFLSLGFTREDIYSLLSVTPQIFKRSLKKQLIPSFQFLKGLIQSERRTISSVKRFGAILCYDLQACVVPNISTLRDYGVPDEKIVFLLTYQPRDFALDKDKFVKIVQYVKELGFHPLKSHFILAIHAFRSMSKSTWEKKMEVYKKWGWSEDEIFSAFAKHPWFMMASEDKIMSVMDVLVNKMGFESSLILRRPVLISLSLDKRIRPRCFVYEALFEKGLVGKKFNLMSFFEFSEAKFLKRYIECHKKEAPELTKLYRKKLSL